MERGDLSVQNAAHEAVFIRVNHLATGSQLKYMNAKSTDAWRDLRALPRRHV